MNLSELMARELGAVILTGFLLGSIPSGYVIGKIWGVDVTKSGSRNIGATNVNRVAGKTAGLLTLVFDLIKGILATMAPSFLSTSYVPQAAAICGVCAVIGHCFSPFMGGKGGKGVATSLGVFFSITPLLAFISVLVFLLVAGVTRYVSLGSLVGVWFLVVMLASGALGYYPKEILWSSILVAAIVTFRHSENIKRLQAGIENKF
jgi:glycerol-3-phosphate acyltransferase PlsY